MPKGTEELEVIEQAGTSFAAEDSKPSKLGASAVARTEYGG